MLVLSRKPGEKIRVDGPATLTVIRSSSMGVRLGFEAPRSTHIVRDEIDPLTPDEIQKINQVLDRREPCRA